MGEKVLVVEDEKITRSSICEVLRGKGYAVKEAADGAQALEVFKTHPFDLVITDLVMPHMDGLRLVELIHSRWPDVPLLFMTAYLSVRTAKTILRNRADFILKPIQVENLLPTVQRLLRPKVLSLVWACCWAPLL